MSVTIVKDRFILPSQIRLTDKAMMREIGLLARERIIRRTAQGIDATGSPFAPYSPLYAATKAEELGTADVNLRVSGSMLNALQLVDVGETFVVLGFSS